MIESSSIIHHSAVKSVLHYYATFRYPLKVEEIHYNCTQKYSLEEVESIITNLLKSGIIHSYKKYYSTNINIDKWVKRREMGEERAEKVLPSAMRYGRLIASFPFVRFAGISGSLSKGFAGKDNDFDYFIITATNRLWICRTILHFFKKLSYLFRLQHKLCMNYFIDENHCEIEEKNLYTAIELSSLKAVSGKKHYDRLMHENQWRKNFLPNGYRPFFDSEQIVENDSLIKRTIEWLLNPLGNQLNQYLMDLTDRKWRRKWRRKNYPMEDYDLAFKTTLHHSKNHPANYQKKVLSKMENFQTSKA